MENLMDQESIKKEEYFEEDVQFFEKMKQYRIQTFCVYILFILGFFSFGISTLFAAIYSLFQKKKMYQSIYYSHHVFLLGILGITLVISLIGYLFLDYLIGYWIILIVLLWFIIQMLRGFYYCFQLKPIL